MRGNSACKTKNNFPPCPGCGAVVAPNVSINEDEDEFDRCAECIGGIVITADVSSDGTPPETRKMSIRHASKVKVELVNDGAMVVLHIYGDYNGRNLKEAEIGLTRGQAISIVNAVMKVLD